MLLKIVFSGNLNTRLEMSYIPENKKLTRRRKQDLSNMSFSLQTSSSNKSENMSEKDC